MGWDAGLNRRLAVPLAVAGVVDREHERYFRRILKEDEDAKDIEILKKLAENKAHIERLLKDIDDDPEMVCSPDISNELDYINATIQLELLEITGELEESPYSEEVFEQAIA
jgi:hypothetical protein